MASKVPTKITFEASRTIEPIYTGGDVSADASGQYLATCVEDDVFVIDAESGKPLVRIEGDGEPITSLSLSPSVSHLIICSRSLSMRIYRLSPANTPGQLDAELLRNLKPHTTPVVTSAIDSTGTLVATGGADGAIKVWDVRGGFVTHTFYGHGGVVSTLKFFNIAWRVEDDQIVRGKGKGKREGRGGEHNEGQDDAAAAISLASGGEDGKIRIWNLRTSKPTATLDSHVSVVKSIDYSAQQQTLLSVSRDKTIILWNSNTWKPKKVIATLEVLEDGGFLREGQMCYSGGETGVVRVWFTSSGREVTEKQSPGSEHDAIVAVVPSPWANGLASIHHDQTIRLHSEAPLKDLPPNSTTPALPIVWRISGNHDEIIDLAFVGPQRSLLALATNTESVRIVSAKDSNQPLAASDMRFRDQFGSDIALLEGHEDIIICLDVDWSGHWLATGAKDNSARLWRLDPEISSYACFARFIGHAESLGAIALPRIAPSGIASKDPLNHPPAFLITGSQDRTVKRWDTSKLVVARTSPQPHTVAKALYTRVAHEKDINAIDVSPIAPLFASASQDRSIKIWSLEDGSVAGILRGHKRGVWSIRFAPANTAPVSLTEGGSSGSRGLLVSGSGDRTVKVWSMSSYTCLLTFEGHSNSVLKVLWLPPPTSSSTSADAASDQSHPIIASASSDTLIKLWSVHSTPSAETDHLLTTLSAHTDRIWALATHQLSAYPLISGAADATITFWTDTTSQTLSTATRLASERIEQDQELQNHILAKNYREVITLALQLNHPGRLLRLFEDVIALPEIQKDTGSITGVLGVDEVLGSLSSEQIYLLLLRVRDWNTNARSAPVAQRVLSCLLKRYPASTFVEMAKDRRLKGVRDLFRALEVYTDRHFKRIEELVDESFLLEYTLREMEEVAGVGPGVEGMNGHSNINGDVLMV